jgi:Protein of unknown function (DUF1501)
MTPAEHIGLRMTRRTFLGRAATGVGAMALGSLLNPAVLLAAEKASQDEKWRGVVHPLHFAPRAKRVIFLCMAGGPSHLETFDNKPKLAELHGKPMPESFTKGQQIAQLQGQELKCFAPQFPFQRFGKSGQEISTILPHISGIADDICIIRSMHTEQINHDPAHAFLNCGTSISGRPSMGAWTLYGLGSECDDLPGFIVLISSGGGQDQPVASRQWSSGFLPSRFQGVMFHSSGDPVLYVSRPPGVSADSQSSIIQTIDSLNGICQNATHDSEIATRISQYEMAFRMQTSVPGLMDISKEPQHILDMYGTKGGDGSFAANCLLARRLAERGVRFIQLYHWGWDDHGTTAKDSLNIGFAERCRETDQPIAALLTDLKQRGMLEDTLVVWGGEFGRTSMRENRNGQVMAFVGRDHNPGAFTIWMAGGGIKPGISHGETDAMGYEIVNDPVEVRDLHATLLYALGFDHHKLSYNFQGLEQKLTSVKPARVVAEVLA